MSAVIQLNSDISSSHSIISEQLRREISQRTGCESLAVNTDAFGGFSESAAMIVCETLVLDSARLANGKLVEFNSLRVFGDNIDPTHVDLAEPVAFFVKTDDLDITDLLGGTDIIPNYELIATEKAETAAEKLLGKKVVNPVFEANGIGARIAGNRTVNKTWGEINMDSCAKKKES